MNDKLSSVGKLLAAVLSAYAVIYASIWALHRFAPDSTGDFRLFLELVRRMLFFAVPVLGAIYVGGRANIWWRSGQRRRSKHG